MIIVKIINKLSGLETNRWEKNSLPEDYYEPSFGKPERWVREGQEDISEALESREINGIIEYKLEAEFDRVEEDLGNEPALIALRARRNDLLKNCDWTQLADCPLSVEDKAAWASYRQALRDLPEECEDPANPEWPAQPE